MKNRVNALKNNEKKQPTKHFPRALRENTKRCKPAKNYSIQQARDATTITTLVMHQYMNPEQTNKNARSLSP